MGACRKGYNLFNSMGREHFAEDVFGAIASRKSRRWAFESVWGDTVGPLLCASLRAHRTYQPDPNDSDIACQRCHRWIRTEPHGPDAAREGTK